MRQSALSEVEDNCGPAHDQCNPAQRSSIEDTADRGRLTSTLTTILLPVGAVGVAAGLVLVFTSPKAEKPATARSIRIAPTLGGLDISGRF
jgi:hypothetical protein